MPNEKRDNEGRMLPRFFRSEQGIRSFPDFEHYLNGWIRPYLLGDLKTVFHGSRWWWLKRRGRIKQWPKPGQGGFGLGLLLLSAFETLGAFLAPWGAERPTTYHNIARVARQLRSTRDIPAIMANLSRNVLAHYLWPQTGVPRDAWRWGFGLDLSAENDARLHDILATNKYTLKPTDSTPVPVLKLLLNVHVLRREFHDWVMHRLCAEQVDDRVFKQIQNSSVRSGWQDEKAYRHRMQEKRLRGEPLPGMDDEEEFRKACSFEAMEEEIIKLRGEAKEFGAYPALGVPAYRKRHQPRSVPPELG
jgi:hypothetical protein